VNGTQSLPDQYFFLLLRLDFLEEGDLAGITFIVDVNASANSRHQGTGFALASGLKRVGLRSK
jgi:hypothetical protein